MAEALNLGGTVGGLIAELQKNEPTNRLSVSSLGRSGVLSNELHPRLVSSSPKPDNGT